MRLVVSVEKTDAEWNLFGILKNATLKRCSSR